MEIRKSLFLVLEFLLLEIIFLSPLFSISFPVNIVGRIVPFVCFMNPNIRIVCVLGSKDRLGTWKALINKMSGAIASRSPMSQETSLLCTIHDDFNVYITKKSCHGSVHGITTKTYCKIWIVFLESTKFDTTFEWWITQFLNNNTLFHHMGMLLLNKHLVGSYLQPIWDFPL